MDAINWKRAKVRLFREAYERAAKDTLLSFKFDEKEFFTTYAKYLLEYLEGTVFKEKDDGR